MRSTANVLRIKTAFLILTILAAAAAAQKSTTVKGDENVDFFGSIKDGTYRNGFLRFEVKVPNQWLRFESSEIEAAKKVGVDSMQSGTSKFNRALDEAASREVVVLAVGKKPLGAIENSAFAIGIFKQPSAHVTPKMVTEAAKSLLLTNPNNTLVRDVKTEMIGGQQFAVFDTELTAVGGIKVPLRYYATMIRGYSLTVSMSYADKESLDLMEDAFRSIKFLP